MMLKRIRQKIRQFHNEEKGVVAILFALLFFVILATIAVGVDMSTVYNKKDMAQMVADEAALYAINKYKTYTEQGISKVKALKLANADAEQYIKERGSLLDGTVLKTSANLSFADKDRKTVKADVSISGRHESLMTQAVGMKNVVDYNAKSTAQVSFGVGKYEFIFLVDVSPSMGVGASQSDRNLMNRVIGCRYACHEPWQSTVERAHDAGARLRIDVVKDALRSLVSQLEDVGDIEIKTALYTFSNHIHLRTGLKDGISNFKAHAANLGIHREYLRGGGTNFNGVFSEFKLVMNGMNPSNDVKQHVIILSDAVQRHNLKSGYTNHIWNQTPGYSYYKAAFNPKQCDFLKNNESRTVHAVYVEPDQRLGDHEGAMKGCATSPEFFYRANSAAEIDKAFKELFENILKSVYISS